MRTLINKWIKETDQVVAELPKPNGYLIESMTDKFNFLTILDSKVYWAGYPVKQLVKVNNPRNKHEFSIRGALNWELGTIHLTDENFNKANQLLS